MRHHRRTGHFWEARNYVRREVHISAEQHKQSHRIRYADEQIDDVVPCLIHIVVKKLAGEVLADGGLVDIVPNDGDHGGWLATSALDPGATISSVELHPRCRRVPFLAPAPDRLSRTNRRLAGQT